MQDSLEMQYFKRIFDVIILKPFIVSAKTEFLICAALSMGPGANVSG